MLKETIIKNEKNRNAEAINLSKESKPNDKAYYPDYNLINERNYINFSIYFDCAGDAPVDLMVRHQIDTLDPLSGYPGSIPGWGALPAFDSSNPNLFPKNEIKKLNLMKHSDSLR